jgi:hypothetical protein
MLREYGFKLLYRVHGVRRFLQVAPALLEQ